MPPEATTNMPLIIHLHGWDGNEKTSFNSIPTLAITKLVLSGDAYNSGKFAFIAPKSSQYYKNGTYSNDNIMNIIEDVVSEYEIDRERIILTGFSAGAWGTWEYGMKYPNYFAALVPVSSGANNLNYSAFKMPIKAMSGTKEDSWKEMKKIVDEINKAGGQAELVPVAGSTHGDTQVNFPSVELFDWMLAQNNKNGGTGFTPTTPTPTQTPTPNGSVTQEQPTEEPTEEPTQDNKLVITSCVPSGNNSVSIKWQVSTNVKVINYTIQLLDSQRSIVLDQKSEISPGIRQYTFTPQSTRTGLFKMKLIAKLDNNEEISATSNEFQLINSLSLNASQIGPGRVILRWTSINNHAYEVSIKVHGDKYPGKIYVYDDTELLLETNDSHIKWIKSGSFTAVVNAIDSKGNILTTDSNEVTFTLSP